MEGPYTHVGELIASDIRRSDTSANDYLELLESIVAGKRPPLVNETGSDGR